MQQFPTNYNIELFQGSFFRRTLVYKVSGIPLDLTGYTVRAQIRSTPQSTLIKAFTTTIPNPTNGNIVMELLATETAELNFVSAKYDVELIPPTGEEYASRILQGDVLLSKEITKSAP